MLRFAFALVLATGFASAAPLPPSRPLTTELLIGRWAYSWGSQHDGWIIFYPDGRYVSRHSPGTDPAHVGFWWVRGDVLTLLEGRCPCPGDWGAAVCANPYPIRVSTASYPTLHGESYGTAVALSSPHR